MRSNGIRSCAALRSKNAACRRLISSGGGGAPGPNVPPEHFGTLATTRLQLPAGRWRVHTVSDDGIRVWIDGQRLIDDWTWHPPKDNDTVVELDAGAHEIRIEHFEIDGHAQLQFRLEPQP